MRKTPVTLGVLAIVFGSVLALVDLLRLLAAAVAGSLNKTLGAAMANAPRQPGAPDPTLVMQQAEAIRKAVAPYAMSLLATMVLFSVVLIVVGVGLYKRRTWARSAALGWSALGLLYLAVDVVVHLSIILPKTQAATRELVASLPDADKVGPMMQAMGGAQTGVVVLTALGLAVFPVLLLILLGRRSAAADFVD